MIERLFQHGLKSGERSCRFRMIRPVYEDIILHESAAEYEKIDRITSPSTVFSLFEFLKKETKEHVLSLHLDSKNHLLCMEHVSIGSMNASVVHPREVYKSALLSSAAGVIMVHNHPSGDPNPSREDIEITGRLKEVGELIGIRLIDHVIIGDTYVSLADQGMC